MRKRADACEDWEWVKGLKWRDGSESDSHLNLLQQMEPSRIRCVIFWCWMSHWSQNISITWTVSYTIDRSGPVWCTVINFSVFKKHSISEPRLHMYYTSFSWKAYAHFPVCVFINCITLHTILNRTTTSYTWKLYLNGNQEKL